jgi:hypothetical protein
MVTVVRVTIIAALPLLHSPVRVVGLPLALPAPLVLIAAQILAPAIVAEVILAVDMVAVILGAVALLVIFNSEI